MSDASFHRARISRGIIKNGNSSLATYKNSTHVYTTPLSILAVNFQRYMALFNKCTNLLVRALCHIFLIVQEYFKLSSSHSSIFFLPFKYMQINNKSLKWTHSSILKVVYPILSFLNSLFLMHARISQLLRRRGL